MNEEKRIEFYGRKIGAWLPMITMVIVMIMLVITGNVSLKLFWIAGFSGLCAGFLLAKDKKFFNQTVLEGLTDPMFSVLCMAFILAGILSQMLRQSGLIDGLLWFSTTLGLDSAFIPAITFAVCVLISTSCGTTGGTVSTVTPIMLPLAVQLGCNPALIMGAIISGAYFGDNLAPISDTTIASSLTQEAEVPQVVQSRFKYSIIAGATAFVLYIYFGFKTTEEVVTKLNVDSSHAKTLIMLVVPVLMVILMLKGMDLVPTLLICNMLALVLNLGMKFIDINKVISVEGPIVAGVDGMISIVVFCMFLFEILQMTKKSGVFEDVISGVSGKCKSPMQAELVSAVVTIFAVVTIAISTVAIVVVGPIVRQLLKKFQVDRRRGANIIDGLAAATAGVLPYNGSFMMATALAFSSGVLSDSFSVLSIPKFSFHCIMLFAVYFVSIFTGWGRKFENEE